MHLCMADQCRTEGHFLIVHSHSTYKKPSFLKLFERVSLSLYNFPFAFPTNFRIFKVFHGVPRFKVVINTLLHILPSLATYGSVLFVIYYFFAMIGMSVFAGKIKVSSPPVKRIIHVFNKKFEFSARRLTPAAPTAATLPSSARSSPRRDTARTTSTTCPRRSRCSSSSWS